MVRETGWFKNKHYAGLSFTGYQKANGARISLMQRRGPGCKNGCSPSRRRMEEKCAPWLSGKTQPCLRMRRAPNIPGNPRNRAGPRKARHYTAKKFAALMPFMLTIHIPACVGFVVKALGRLRPVPVRHQRPAAHGVADRVLSSSSPCWSTGSDVLDRRTTATFWARLYAA